MRNSTFSWTTESTLSGNTQDWFTKPSEAVVGLGTGELGWWALVCKSSGARTGLVNYVSEKQTLQEWLQWGSDEGRRQPTQDPPPKIFGSHLSPCKRELKKESLLRGDIQLPQQLPHQRDFQKDLRKSPEKKDQRKSLGDSPAESRQETHQIWTTISKWKRIPQGCRWNLWIR